MLTGAVIIRIKHIMDPALVLMLRHRKVIFLCLILMRLFLAVMCSTTCPCPQPCWCECLKKHVECSRVFLTDVPKIGRELSKLRSYHLDVNRIRRIEDETFANISSLVELNLASNIIAVIEPFAFSGLGNLKYLYLQNNRITEMFPVHNLPSLRKFYLHKNHIKTILVNDMAYIKGKVMDMSHLDLSFNNIFNLPIFLSEYVSL